MNSTHPFYESLAHGIATVVGDLILYFTEGDWNIGISGQDFLVRCPADCTAELTFDYSYGTLNSAVVQFQPSIGIVLPGVATELVVLSATYNRLGDCTGVVFDAGSSVADDDMRHLKRLLSLRREPSHLLLGEPFAYLVGASSTGQPQRGRMIWRLRFERNGPIPGLAVKMKDHAVLRFSEAVSGRGDTRNNYVVVRDGTGFVLDRVDYVITDRTVEGSLSKFAAVLDSGAIDASGVFLQLGSDSTLRFDNIDFGRASNGDTVVDATYGDIIATASGGRIALDGPDAASEIDLAAGESRVEFIGLRLFTKGGVANLTVGAGSNLYLKLSHGLLRFPAIGFTSFGAGELNATVSGQWSSGVRPVVEMDISRLAVADASGELALGGPTRVQFVHGELASSALAFRSGVGLTGSFSKFVFALTAGSTLAFSDDALLQAGDGGAVDATYGGSPLAVAQGSFPQGVIGFTQPFARFEAGRPRAFALTDGVAKLVLQLASDGSFEGRDGRVSGLLTAEAGGALASAQTNVTEVEVTRAAAGAVSVAGNLDAVIGAGFSLTFTTPFVKGVPDHDNMRVFPVTLTAALQSNVALGPTRLKLANGEVGVAPVALRFPIALTVPAGIGEHEDPDNPGSADGTHGPDEDKHRQEVYTDTFGPLRAHIYLYDGTYHFDVDVTIAASGLALDVNVTNVKLATGESIGWHRDGGDLGIIGAIIGAMAGALLFGGFGAAMGGIVGKIEGDNLNDAVNKLIAGKIAEKLLALRYQWHVQL